MNSFINYCKTSFHCLIFISFSLFILGLKFTLKDLVYFIEWEILSLNSMSIVMTFLFDWTSLLFMSFVLLTSSLVKFYSNQYM